MARVGDGKSIHVWQDWWLPIPISYAQSQQRIIGEDTQVVALINSDLCSWKTTLLQEVFNEEPKVIANIPLSPTLPPDQLIWNGIIDGVFLVRSAYHMGMEIQERSKGGPSSDGNGHDIWKAIWNLRVQNPLKLFLWKACHNLLPTKVNLCRPKVVEDKLCPCCTREAELVLHAL